MFARNDRNCISRQCTRKVENTEFSHKGQPPQSVIKELSKELKAESSHNLVQDLDQDLGQNLGWDLGQDLTRDLGQDLGAGEPTTCFSLLPPIVTYGP